MYYVVSNNSNIINIFYVFWLEKKKIQKKKLKKNKKIGFDVEK
jgi:hypothetical protein